MWENAAALQRAEDYAAAEQAYRQILESYPESQRSHLRVAIAQERGGKPQESLATYRDAILMDVDSSWGATGLFFMARAAKDQDAPQDFDWARDMIGSRHPDSAWSVRVEILDAQRRGNTAEASLLEAALENEIEATEHLNEALALSSANQLDNALLMLQQGLAEYSGQRVSWQLKEAEGHVLIRQGRWDEAGDAFAEILTGLAHEYPQSRVVTVSLKRLAGIAHATGRKDEALTQFQQLLAIADNPSASEHAVLQICGLLMEQILEERPVSRARTLELEKLLRETLNEPSYSRYTRCRTALMLTELYLWQGRFDDLHEVAALFTDSEEGFAMDDSLRLETASAYITIAQACMLQHRYKDVILLCDRVLEKYPEAKRLWPTMDHLERAYYFRYGAYRTLGQKGKADRVLEEFEERFPASVYLRSIETMNAYPDSNQFDRVADQYGDIIRENVNKERIRLP